MLSTISVTQNMFAMSMQGTISGLPAWGGKNSPGMDNNNNTKQK